MVLKTKSVHKVLAGNSFFFNCILYNKKDRIKPPNKQSGANHRECCVVISKRKKITINLLSKHTSANINTLTCYVCTHVTCKE